MPTTILKLGGKITTWKALERCAGDHKVEGRRHISFTLITHEAPISDMSTVEGLDTAGA
jgi:hypothetical protein